MKKTVKTKAKAPAPVKKVVNNREFVPTKAELAELTEWHLSIKDRAFQIGERLNDWKSKLEHGKWTPFFDKWVAPIMSQKSANNYMTLATNKAKLVKFTNLTMQEMLNMIPELTGKAKGKRRGRSHAPKAPKAPPSKADSIKDQLDSMGNGDESDDDLITSLRKSVASPTPDNIVKMTPISYTRESFRKAIEATIKPYQGNLIYGIMVEELKDVVFHLSVSKGKRLSKVVSKVS